MKLFGARILQHGGGHASKMPAWLPSRHTRAFFLLRCSLKRRGVGVYGKTGRICSSSAVDSVVLAPLHTSLRKSMQIASFLLRKRLHTHAQLRQTLAQVGEAPRVDIEILEKYGLVRAS
jgi:hypothetical protein